jgi:GT2 family glycosyltransferase
MSTSPIKISKCRCLIGLCSWQNPQILYSCLLSLVNSIDLSKDRIAVVLNEADADSVNLLYSNKIPFVFNPENSGPLAIDFLKGFIENSSYFLNSNDDMLFHPGFVEDLISIIDTNYPATASCGLVENFFSNNPCVVVDDTLKDMSTETYQLFINNHSNKKYNRQYITYGYNHPIMCRSQDLLDVGGYSGLWDPNFLSGYSRDDMFPYELWKKSNKQYKFLVSKESSVFHFSSFTNRKLPMEYRQKNHNQDKFANITGMSLQDFRYNAIKIGNKLS